MGGILRVFRSVVFLGWLSVVLAATALGAAVWAVQLAGVVATMSASAAATAIAHRKELARAVARAKAKARLRRLIAAIPVAGAGAIVYFEEQDFQEWLSENPDGTRQEYACEVAAVTAEVIDEVLQELPEWSRHSPETLRDRLSDCT